MEQDSVTPPVNRPTFEESYDEIYKIVQRRKGKWPYISIMPWEEVSQILIIRIHRKWGLYDPAKTKKLERWVNTVVSHAIRNLIRDNLGRWSRPCIGGGAANGVKCSYNLGGEGCSYTKSKTQCSECPVYAKWQKERQHQLHIKSNVALEHHAQEVSNIQGDFIDSNKIKEELDVKMLEELTAWEGKVYKLLFIKYLKPAEVTEELEKVLKSYKRAPAIHEKASYQAVLEHRRNFESMMKEHLRRDGHIE
jgi:hypothetical protein